MEPIVQVAYISGAFGLVSLVVNEIRLRKQDRQQNVQLAQIKHQVQNSHETNLRDDVDKVLTGVQTLVEGQRRQGKEISGIREDLRVERQERMDVERRLDDHTRNHH